MCPPFLRERLLGGTSRDLDPYTLVHERFSFQEHVVDPGYHLNVATSSA